MSKKLVLRVTSENVITDAEWKSLMDALEGGTFTIVDRRDVDYDAEHKRWVAWLQVKPERVIWCNECNQYTKQTFGSWAYKGFRECAICGRRIYS